MLVLGDAHADDPDNREALFSAYEAANEDVALQTGDLGSYDVPVPTWFVAGNNEDLDVVDALRRGDRSLTGDRDLHLLASNVADVGGLRIAGLSGNFAPTQYEKSRDELSGDRRRHFVRADVDQALALDDVDVFLAHEAPHGLLSFGYDPGSDPLDEICSTVSPDLLLVGHFHRHAEATIDGTRVVSLAPVWESYYTLDPETLALERHEAPDPE